jgi:hypothetical protein
MPVSWEFQHGIFIVTATGNYAADELVQAIGKGYSDPEFVQTTPVLVDARQSAANPSSEDVRQTCRRIIGRRPPGHIGKWAIVTGHDPLRFGIGRMGSLTMETLGISVEVFTEMDAALTYVSRQPERA